MHTVKVPLTPDERSYIFDLIRFASEARRIRIPGETPGGLQENVRIGRIERALHDKIVGLVARDLNEREEKAQARKGAV
jgi:hypothetical protein